jgi:hypothetical protein
MITLSSKREYYLYVHINKLNFKSYIGITRRNPIYRWGKNGYYYKTQYFGRVIKKYFWVGFYHDVLYSNLTKLEAETLEYILIKKLHLNDKRFGYNIDNGGTSKGKVGLKTKQKMSDNISKKVNQYSLDGTYLNTYKGAKEAMKITGVDKSAISMVCSKKRISAGEFLWCFEGDHPNIELANKNINKILNRKEKKISKYDLNGSIVNKYNSLTEASKSIDGSINHIGNISSCCNGKQRTSYGYIWRYIDENG